jgi:coenzyme F420-reducing hydrogenase delta subunit
MDPERLRLRWVSASEGARFAEEIRDFTDYLRKTMDVVTGESDESAKVAVTQQAS